MEDIKEKIASPITAKKPVEKTESKPMEKPTKKVEDKPTKEEIKEDGEKFYKPFQRLNHGEEWEFEQNNPADQELFNIVCNAFGTSLAYVDESPVQKNLILAITKMAIDEHGDDLSTLNRYISRLLRRTSGPDKLRAIYRKLKIERDSTMGGEI